MKAKELARRIFLTEYTDRGHTVDRIFMGDGEREVRRAAVCMVITPDVLQAAADWGAGMIITHEPTFGTDDEARLEGKPYEFKRRLIEASGMAVCRWHDSPHYGERDLVNEALVRRMNWRGYFDGKFRFELEEPLAPLAIAEDLRNRLNIRHPRIVGRRDGEVRRISLQTGQRGTDAFLEMLENDTDLVIAGETCEWYCCEPIRDMAQLGMQKTVILLGHAGSERDAMADLAQRINAGLGRDGIEAKYFDCGELYSYAD